MARAMGLALLADKLPAEKAAEWGLIWAMRGGCRVRATVDKLAATAGRHADQGLVRTRQAMHAAPNHTLEQQLSWKAASCASWAGARLRRRRGRLHGKARTEVHRQ
jgi:2-(1,2-epoxy-1,2-dihydrophenyl)acetyl-CoA isomerase